MPIARQRPSATAIPSPSPFAFDSSSLVNGVKIVSSASSLTPGPESAMRRWTASAPVEASIVSGEPSPYLSEFSMMLTSTRSRSPKSTSTHACGSMSTVTSGPGSPSVPTPTSARAAVTRSDTGTGDVEILTAPDWMRLMSRRLSMSFSSRRVPFSMVASMSFSSASERSISSRSSVDVAALIAPSGVRRSWETAVSRAVRTALPALSSRASDRVAASSDSVSTRRIRPA